MVAKEVYTFDNKVSNSDMELLVDKPFANLVIVDLVEFVYQALAKATSMVCMVKARYLVEEEGLG